MKIIFITISLIILFSNINSTFLKRSILEEPMLSFDAKCSIPMLGTTLAEIQINQDSHVIAIVDIEKNFKEMGIENNEETNPSKTKSINIIYKKDLNKLGLFWQNTNGEVFVTRPDYQLTEIITSCAVWMKDFIKIVKHFAYSSPSPLEKDEDQFGNSKYTFENSEEEVEYGYIFQDEKLTALTQVRPPQYALLANLIAFVENSKAIIESDFVIIPEGIQYEEAD